MKHLDVKTESFDAVFACFMVFKSHRYLSYCIYILFHKKLTYLQKCVSWNAQWQLRASSFRWVTPLNVSPLILLEESRERLPESCHPAQPTILSPPPTHTHTLTQTHSNRCTFHYCRMSYLRAKRGGEKALWEQQISCLQPFKKNKTKAARLKARAAALITAEPHFGHRLRLSTNTRTSLKSIYYGNTFCNNVNNKHPPEPININIKTQLILDRISLFFASRLRRKKNICVFVGEQKMQESVRMWF